MAPSCAHGSVVAPAGSDDHCAPAPWSSGSSCPHRPQLRFGLHPDLAFSRDPGHDGWPAGEVRHIHAVYTGAHLKDSLRAQVRDWLNGPSGLASHAPYHFFQPTVEMKAARRDEGRPSR